MADNTPQRGNALDAYKQMALETPDEPALVGMWRNRIDRAWTELRLDDRIVASNNGDGYLNGTAKARGPNSDKYVYYRYLLPMLEDLHRQTLPRLPAASAYARTEQAKVFEDKARELVDYYMTSPWSGVHAVATQVQWATIERVAATQKIDVWILFPLMAVNRLLANDHRKAFGAPLDRVFGTRGWLEEFYHTRVEADIFGQSIEVVRKACDSDIIGRFYLDRLRSVFAGVAPKPRVFMNSRHAPLFSFFFAAGNSAGAPIAVKIADYLLEKL